MRIMNVDGRLTLVVPDGVVDVATASGAEFAPGVEPVYARWDQFRAWADGYAGGPTGPAPAGRIGPPVPRPPQVFAIGLNYRSHATETGAELPASPMVSTKFPARVTGPYDDVALPDGSVDFEAELVAVIGREAGT
jgi:2-keto-4-pentenoate hydratase/2-oxohepta-3-ene-1,7-dioic acid hydratase in catechol pathway